MRASRLPLVSGLVGSSVPGGDYKDWREIDLGTHAAR
jgi:hypothetical protein